MNFLRIPLFVFVILLLPNCVWASGGGPLLLLFNGSVFVIGQIWIIGIEFIIYRRLIKVSKQDALGDVFVVNIFSTLIVSFGFALIIVAVGLAGSFLPGNIGETLSAIGTWVYENSKHSKLAVYMALFWFISLFIVTVYFEAWIYKSRWKKRGFVSGVNPITLCWYTNTVSHIGLFVSILIIWHELI